MTIYVPTRLAGSFQLEALHAAWDERNQAPSTQSHAANHNQPAGPQARAVFNPYRGTRHFLPLLARASAGKWAAAANLLGPVSRSQPALAGAFTRAVNMGAAGIHAMAASTSPALAKGTNAISPSAFEARKNVPSAEDTGTASVAGHIFNEARSMARQRANVLRFMQPMLKAA